MRSAAARAIALLTAVGAVGCTTGNDAKIVARALPDADLSSSSVDFGTVSWGETATRQVVLKNGGELPMGIESIELLAEGMEDNFSLAWNPNGILCPDEGEASSARSVATDTGSTPVDTGGGGGGADTGGTGPASGEVTVLDAGCTLPINVTFSPVTVGEVHAAFAVTTTTEDVEGNAKPAYYRDPDQIKKVVMLEGVSERGQGNVVVKSPGVDLGHHYVGETSSEHVYILNVGDGELAVSEPTLADDCDPAFSLDLSQLVTDRPLEAGESTLFDVVFTPVDLDPALCDITVTTDDPDTPEVTVSARGNYGTDPENKPPTVAIRSPEVGYLHNSADPLVLEINVFDQNQPATTLYCKVKSYLNEGGSIADCTPTDESGHVFVEIPIDDLETGTDTLKVQVTDQSENRAYASTTVLWMAEFPDSDDDGDGWGDDDPTDTANYDCDDSDPTVYPYAAEIYDGKDNDCDGGIDEGTEGSDDDGDGVTEVDGDCDDADADTYPNAPEISDMKDNDCDGTIDEGTSFYDDDGDGFSETDNDCDDSDPDINPAATEICDGIDNNCNGLKDQQEGCIETDSSPIIVGGIRMSQSAIGVGESTTMTVYAYDADGQPLTYLWQEDADLTELGHTAIDNPSGQSITWKAPDELPSGSQGEVYSVTVIVMDPDGNQDWDFEEIWVYPESVSTTIDEVIQENDKGCGGSSSADTGAAAALPVFSLFGLFAAARRRRREDREED